MALSISQLEKLKTWFLHSDKDKGEADIVLSDQTLTKAINALEKKLDGSDSISIASLVDAIDRRDQSFVVQLTLLNQYLDMVLKPKNNTLVYVAPDADHPLFKLVQENFRLSNLVGENLRISPQAPSTIEAFASVKAKDTHPAVDGVLRRFSPTMTSLSFPGGVDGAGLQANDNFIFLRKLSATIAMNGNLNHLMLTEPNNETFTALSDFYGKGGVLKVKNLHFNLDRLELTDNNIDAFVTALKALPHEDIGEIVIDAATNNSQQLQALVNKIIQEQVAITVKLPGKSSQSKLQHALDSHCGNAQRAKRIQQMSVARVKNELGEAAYPKRTRVRVKERNLNIEVELQQQQQVEVQEQRSLAEEKDDNSGLNILTFEDLRHRIKTRKLPISLDKNLLTQVDLYKAWANWFGHVATYRTPDGKLVGADDAVPGSDRFNLYPNNIFQHITEEACVVLLNHGHQFQYGLDYNHLPAGFEIIHHPTCKDKVLHFNQSLANVPKQDDLAIKLNQPLSSVPCDEVTKELMAAYQGHPCHAIIAELLQKITAAAKYDRDALQTVKSLLPTLFLYVPEDLKFIIKLSRSENRQLDANVFRALVNYNGRKNGYNFQYHTDDAIEVLQAVCENSFNREKYDAIQRQKSTYANHPLTLILAKFHAEFNREFQNWAKKKKCSVDELNGLYEVYVAYGVEGLKKILNLADTHGKSFDMLRLSLQHGNNYLQCIHDPRALRAITNICNLDESGFTPEELGWFNALLQQHAAATKDFNLADLLDSFTEFTRKIKEYKLKFYLPVGFNNVKNMPVALGRMLSILKLTDPKERQTQWNCITRLALEADGAIHAVQDNESSEHVCHVVVPEMETFAMAYNTKLADEYRTSRDYGGVSDTGYQAGTGFNFVSKYNKDYVEQSPHAIKRVFIEREFYRHVAAEEYRRPLDEYPDLLEIIKSRKFQPEIEMVLYKLLALSSTGLANSYENDKLSRDEYKKKFNKFVSEIDSARLSIALMATVNTFILGPIAVYKLQGRSFMVEEMRAPHADFSVNDLLKFYVLEDMFLRLKAIPSVASLYYLAYFASSGLKDAGIMRFINDGDKNNAFRIMADIEHLSWGDYLTPFCNGMRFFKEKDIKSIAECRKYLDACLEVQEQARRSSYTYRDKYKYNRNYYNTGYGNYQAEREKVEKVTEQISSVGGLIISIISTFGIRDTVLGDCKDLLDLLPTTNKLDNIIFALSMLVDIDLTVGEAKGARALTQVDFTNFVNDMIVSSRNANWDNKAIINRVKELFGDYFIEGYFERLDADKISVEVKKKVDVLFKLETDQDRCMNFLKSYKDESDIQQYDKFIAILTHFAKRLSAADMSLLLDQIGIIADIYVKTQQAPPSFAEYIKLLETVLEGSQLNTLVYYLSSSTKTIAALAGNEDAVEIVTKNYMKKVFSFMGELAPIYKVNSTDILSQADLMNFTSKFLNNTEVRRMGEANISHPSDSMYGKIAAKVFSDQAIDAYCKDPAAFEDHLNSIMHSIPELTLMPELVALQNHVKALNQEQARRLAAAEEAERNETLAARVGKTAVAVQAAGLQAYNYVGSWVQQLRGVELPPKRPEVMVDTSLRLDTKLIDAAKSAIENKRNMLKTYAGVVTSLVENMRLLVNRYPATRNEMMSLIELYCTNFQLSGATYEESIANIIKLRNLFLNLDNEKLVFALCFHFNNATDKDCHAPEELFAIINDDCMTQQTAEHRVQLLEILVKLLNNESIDDLEQFKLFCNRLLKLNSEMLYIHINEIYKTAPYPSLDSLMEWLDEHETALKKYREYELLPCRRECADDEPNGFKLAVAKEKVKLFIGIDITDAELEELSKETIRVRSLSILQLLEELKQFRESFVTEDMLPKLVAINTELLYRAKGSAASDEDPANKKWGASFEINTTQYLSIYSLLKCGEHVTGKIETSEGKTRISMISLACQFALGKTVDFCTDNASLAYREFTEFQSYFDLLGAQSRLIHADSPAEHYAIRGINFSDPASIELFRNRKRSEGLAHLVIDPVKHRRAMMLDEGDKTYYDLSDTRFNYSAASDEMLKDMDWMYVLLAAFVEERKVNDPSSYRYADLFYDDMDKCLEEFLNYISKVHVPAVTPEQFARVKLLPQQQIEGWFDAALTARDLKFKKDFNIVPDMTINTAYGPKIASEAKLIVQNRLDHRSKYSFGVHQCLHARLSLMLANIKQNNITHPDQVELNEVLAKCDKTFHIEDEKQIIYTSSSKTFLNDYDYGTLYVVTGTAGSASERKEAAMLYAHKIKGSENPPEPMKFVDVPRHMRLQRIDRPVMLVADDEQEIAALARQIKLSRLTNQPTMIVCSDDAECHRLSVNVKKYMEKHGKEVGEWLTIDTMVDLKDEIKAVKYDIGRPKVVTFTTSKLGRGTDVTLHGDSKKHGLKVCTSGTLVRHRDFWQVIARAARFGAPGESRVIINKARIKRQLNKTTLTDGFYTSPQTYIHREQAIIDRKKQVERLIKFAFVDFRSNLQTALYGKFQHSIPASSRMVMRRLWQTCSTEMDQKWNEIYERLANEVRQDVFDDVKVDALLQEMHDFTAKQWKQLYTELSQDPAIAQTHANNQCLDNLLREVPPFKLAPDVLDILKNYSLEDSYIRERPIYDRYDPAHDGQTAIYRHRFELLRATFAGERKIFADLRAWWNGHGILLANIRGWWRGDITFKQLILGGKGEAAILPAKTVASTATIGRTLGMGGVGEQGQAPTQTPAGQAGTTVVPPPLTTAPTMYGAGQVPAAETTVNPLPVINLGPN